MKDLLERAIEGYFSSTAALKFVGLLGYDGLQPHCCQSVKPGNPEGSEVVLLRSGEGISYRIILFAQNFDLDPAGHLGVPLLGTIDALLGNPDDAGVRGAGIHMSPLELYVRLALSFKNVAKADHIYFFVRKSLGLAGCGNERKSDEGGKGHHEGTHGILLVVWVLYYGGTASKSLRNDLGAVP